MERHRPYPAELEPNLRPGWCQLSQQLYLKFDGAGTNFINVFAGLGSYGHGIGKTAEKGERVVLPSKTGIVCDG